MFHRVLLGGSWDFLTAVISTLFGALCNCKYGYLIYNPSDRVSTRRLQRVYKRFRVLGIEDLGFQKGLESRAQGPPSPQELFNRGHMPNTLNS